MLKTSFFLAICLLSACAGSSGSSDLSTIPSHFRETFPVALAEPSGTGQPAEGAVLHGIHAPLKHACADCSVLYDGPVSLGRALALWERSLDATVIVVRKSGTPDAVSSVMRLARKALVDDGMIVSPYEVSEDGSPSWRFLYQGTRDGKPVRGIVTAALVPGDGSVSMLLAMEYPAARQETAARVYGRYAEQFGLAL